MTITRARACEGKRRLSRQAALRMVERLEAEGAAEGSVAAYLCPFSGNHWHVGHVPRRAAQQEETRRRRRRRRR